MRCLPFLVCALMLPTSAHAAGHGTGGTAAPSSGGGMTYAQPIEKQARRAPRRRIRPIATEFAVAPAALTAGTTATFAFRIDGPAPRVRVRIELTRTGAPAPAVRLRLGRVTTGRRHVHHWTPAPGELPVGEYAVALQAVDDRGRSLRRTATASGRGRLAIAVPPPPEGIGPGVFPVAGPYSFGEEDARFGAARKGHVHQGQDIVAAEGTPLVAPVAGSIYWIDFQRKGAGHYVVVRGIDGRDYVFMHLVKGSILVARGAPLAAGQQFAQVGNTGASSGPHLHFEIWPDGWYSAKASAPIDPLPQLQAWAAAR